MEIQIFVDERQVIKFAVDFLSSICIIIRTIYAVRASSTQYTMLKQTENPCIVQQVAFIFKNSVLHVCMHTQD